MLLLLLILQKNWLKSYYIENWNIITDLEGAGISNFPLSAIKTLMNRSSLMLCGRLHQMIILNPSMFFYGLWKIAQKYMHEDTLAKIKIIKKGDYSKLVKLFGESKLLKKYGGSLEEPKKVFPVQLPGSLKSTKNKIQIQETSTLKVSVKKLP